MKKLTPDQLKVFRDINDSIPKAWLRQLVVKSWAYPDIRKVVDKGLEDPDVSEKVKNKLREIKNSDVYTATKEFINHDIEAKIDKHVSRKVNAAIKSGALPPLTKDDFYVKPVQGLQPNVSGEEATA